MAFHVLVGSSLHACTTTCRFGQAQRRLEPSTDIEQRAAAAVVVVVVGVESGDLLPPSVSPSISPILGLTCSGILEAAGSQSSAP